MAQGPRHDDEPADRGAPRPGRLEVQRWSRWPPAGPARSTPTSASSATASAACAAAGHLGGPQAAVDRLRGDRRRQDRATIAVDPTRRRGRVVAPRRDARRAAERRVSLAVLAGRRDRPRRHRRHRRLQGHRGVPPPGRRRRPRRARPDRGRPALRRARPRSRRWPPSRPRPRCGTTPTRSRTPASARAPTSWWSCPATARLLGAYAAGISDDLLTATLLATRAPVVVCPAMHTEMWEHPAVQDNLATLRRRGVHVVEPEIGPPGRRRHRRRPAGRARAPSSPRSRRLLAPRDLDGRAACSSPPAAPASRSTPCASSPTARRASRATPSPRRPRPGAPRSRSSPPSTAPAPAGRRGRRGRDRGRDGSRPC